MVASVDLTGIGKLFIGSAYFPHDAASHPPEEVRSLVDYCKVRRLPLLLGCDAPGAFGIKLKNGGSQMNPPYLTICR